MPSVTGTAYHLGSAAQVLEPVLVDQCREVLLVHLRHVESAPNRVSLALVLDPPPPLLRPSDRQRPAKLSSGVKNLRVQVCLGLSRTVGGHIGPGMSGSLLLVGKRF